jgi:DNA-binding CsgD family transcriptional regulator/tetratricopeptide (TPR) repeat protein
MVDMEMSGSQCIGRDREIRAISAALQNISLGRPAVVLVRGEPGIGKTALVDRIASRSAGDQLHVVRGFCAPVEASVMPYGPIAALVTDLISQYPDILASLSPEVQRGLQPLIGPADIDGTDRNATRLFAAFVELVSAAGRRRPLLAIVEDLHWADAASVDLLSWATRTVRAPVGFLLTRRDTPADGTAAAELSRIPGAVTLALAPLDDAAMHQLLEPMIDPPDADRIARISVMSAGIPFIAVHLASQPDIGSAPATVVDSLATSVETLPPSERRLLVLLAVLGSQPDDVLVRAADLPSPELDRLCRELRRRHLIVVHDDGIDFRHALIREAVTRSMGPGERRDAHHAAADALLSSGAGRDPTAFGSLSYHLHACGRHQEALPYTLKAARRAQTVSAFSDARTLYNTLRRWWPSVEHPADVAGASWNDVLRESATAAQWSGDPRGALELLTEAATFPLTAEESAATQLATGRALAAAGETVAALLAYRRALAVLPPHGPHPLRLSALAALAQALMLAGQSQEAVSVAGEALVVETAAGDERDRTHAVITAAAARAQLGDAETAITMLETCLPQVLRIDDLELILRCYSNLAFALGVLGRHADCARIAADGIRACRRFGNVTSLVTNLRNNEVSALVVTGRWDQAVATARQALADVSNPGVAFYLRTRIAEVELARGRRPAADTELAAARALGVEDPYAVAAVARLTAERALQDGDPAAAADAAATAISALRSRQDAVPLLRTCWLALRAVADQAEAGGALVRHPALDAERDEYVTLARAAAARSPLDVAAVLLTSCEAEAARVTASDTADQWRTAAAGWQRHSEPHSGAYCLFRLAAERLRSQARTAAAQALGDSLRVAQSLGAAPLEQDIRRLAAVGDLPTETTAPADQRTSTPPNARGLTPREQQVLELLATGATNRKVARALHISERTAGVHVSNILNKLGAKNRTEAARMALTLPGGARLDRYQH